MAEKKEASSRERQPSVKRPLPKSASAAVRKTRSEEGPDAVVAAEAITGGTVSSMSLPAMSPPEIHGPNSVASFEASHDSSRESEAAETVANGVAPTPKRERVLDVFLVDSGWNDIVGNAVRENLPVFAGYLKGQRFYVLTKDQSLKFIMRHPSLVGADPILIVLDREAVKQKTSKGYGFRLCLGHMRNPEAALSMLKWAIQLSMASNGPDMASIVRESGHRQTIQGTIELIGEGSAHLLEFAPV